MEGKAAMKRYSSPEEPANLMGNGHDAAWMNALGWKSFVTQLYAVESVILLTKIITVSQTCGIEKVGTMHVQISRE